MFLILFCQHCNRTRQHLIKVCSFTIHIMTKKRQHFNIRCTYCEHNECFPYGE